LPHYLAHLLLLVGTELPLFEPAAIEAIFQATSGLPRKVNQLAHHVLFTGAMSRAKSATSDHVQTAMQETA
jgi:general secretion pathway protein A